MKKTLALLLVAGSALSLSACGNIPKCNDALDECTHGGPYTEERTIQTNDRRVVAKPAPAPEPAPAPVMAAPKPAPAPVVMPAPAPIVDTKIMRSAEPEFKQISK